MEAMKAEIQEQTEPVIMQVSSALGLSLRYLIIGQALDRIREFSARYDHDSDPMAVVREVEKDLVRDDGHDFLLLVAMRDLEMVGHLLARKIQYFGKLLVYVQQMEIDHGSGVTIDQEREAFKIIQAWGHSQGTDQFRAAAPTAAHRRRLKTLWGFEEYLVNMKFQG